MSVGHRKRQNRDYKALATQTDQRKHSYDNIHVTKLRDIDVNLSE